MQQFIDIGVNLAGSSFKSDVADVIQRAHDAGVNQLIVTGTNIEHSQRAVELCKQYPHALYATAGVHPHHASEVNADTVSELKALYSEAAVVAVGECGLDFNRNYSSPSDQRVAFQMQLQLASEAGLPLFLHQRDAHDEFVSMLREYLPDISGAVAHCFTGTLDEALQYVDMGMYIGVTGWICDERRGGDLQRAVSEIPLEKIILETDAPYLLPRDLKQAPAIKRRNEPCYLPHICEVTAKYMQVDSKRLAESAIENTRRLFSI